MLSTFRGYATKSNTFECLVLQAINSRPCKVIKHQKDQLWSDMALPGKIRCECAGLCHEPYCILVPIIDSLQQYRPTADVSESHS